MFSSALQAELEERLGRNAAGPTTARITSETTAVVNAVRAGRRDENDLINLVFFARHPQRGGRRLTAGEPGFERLRQEWFEIRELLVRPLLWGHIRAEARRIALAEYRWWGGGTRTESEPGVRGRLIDYWTAAAPRGVPSGEDVWRLPWSAAFISYVLRTAGAGPNFRYSTAHRTYVHWAIRNAAVDPGHPVRALPVDRVAPRLGDLVCTWRDSRPVTFAELAATSRPPAGHPMHCDIVVDVQPNHVDVAGGNKARSGRSCPGGRRSGCTVNVGRHRLAGGVLAPLPGTARGWIAVLRLGP